jgi:PIN domain nuclease of toxin-antitoxin system
MRLLLDTHIFLWYITSDGRLPGFARENIRDTSNEVYLSPVSLWEALVKHGLRKLPLPEQPETYLQLQREHHQIASLPLDEDSVLQLSQLPNIHRDPFDRMLVCQAIQHSLILVTVDAVFQRYPVKILAS